MLAFLPAEPTRLMDVGCSEGRFAEAVKLRYPACETWGVEPNETAATIASTRIDHVLHGIFNEALDLPKGYFDVVTMNDVLEHLTDTSAALELVKTILRPNGALVLSLPNVRFYLNVKDLVFKNDWEYKDFGVLDRTHFRFFTSKSAKRCLEENGFQVRRLEGLPDETIRWHYRALFALAPNFFHWMRFPQFAVVAAPIK